MPALIVIDGGKGQLSAGLSELGPFRDLGVTVVSLAKRDRGGLPARPRAARSCSPHDTAELQLLQRVRDEAHRFAIEFHRGRRDKAMTRSILDDLPGVGPGAQAQHPAATSARPSASSRRAARSSRRCRGCPARSRATSTNYVNKVR